MQWKGFIAESDTWEKEEDLKNAKELVNDFEGRIGAEIRRQKEVVENKREKKEYRRMELPEKYMAKVLYGWDNKKFEDEYLKKLEKNWRRWKNDRQIYENEHLKNIEEKMEEENEKNKEQRLENRTFLQRRNLDGEVMSISQIRYSLVVILGLNSVSGVQYKDMMIDR